MWANIPTLTFIPLIPTLTTTAHLHPAVATSTFTRRRYPPLTITAAASHENIGGLGKAVLGAIKSSPSTTTNNPGSNTPKKGKPKSGKEKTGQELSGSDILWAMQKAAAKKTQVTTSKKQQQKGKGLAVGSLKRENVKRVVDFDKIRPIVVKSDWATRLVDLENRLQEFLSS